jgi:GT2 family glycosyltransferase/SAM-dependent methyltransferase
LSASGLASALELVICTYNNALMLDQALSALARQHAVPDGSWSCLVVDNNCTDETQEVIERHRAAARIPGLRSVREPMQGLTPARLRGVRTCLAAWIAFVDDDCILEPQWIARALAFTESHAHVGAFGGKVTLDFESEPPDYVRAYGYSFAEQNHGKDRAKVPFLVGAGLVVSRSALSACGWSESPVLPDRVGKRLVSGGDVEIVLRVAAAGYELWYVPECELRHRIPVRRMSPQYLSDINRSLGVSQAMADAMVWEGSRTAWVGTAARRIVKDLFALFPLTAAVARGKRTAADLRIQTSFWLGRVQGVARIIVRPRSQRRRLLGLARRQRTFLPWKVLHLSIRDPLPDLPADAAIGGLFVVFWCDRAPLGQLSIPASLLPIPSAQLAVTLSSIVAPVVAHRVLRRGFEPPLPVPPDRQIKQAAPDLERLLALNYPLDALSRAADCDTPDLESVRISIVVCTRNRPDHLEKCLSSIRTLSPRPHEILVVDNDPSSGATEPIVSRFPEVRYVPEPRVGLSVARNTGVLHTTGSIVTFTDDDVVVHEGWVEAIRAGFHADHGESVMALTGLVLPAALDTPAQQVFQSDALGWGWGYRAVDFDETFFDATKSVGVPVWRLGAGANMAFRREVFELVGFFDERLGAGASGCSEDSELWYRLLAEGYRCRYWPDAVVFHHHRAEWEDLSSQMYSYMRGHVAALFFQFERYRHWGNIYRACLALPWYLLNIARRSVKQRIGRLVYSPKDRPGSLPISPQILGALAGYGYYLRHRTRPAHAMALHMRRRTTRGGKRPLSAFLDLNPFESPLTLGFFYREKMRAIHRIAPEKPLDKVLEVGGGRSGLTRLLYPSTSVTNLDMDASFADAPCNRQEGVRFVCGDATMLEFDDGAFDAVTMFDVLEHVQDHERAVVEALRVLKPGGYLLVSTPNERWRFPYYRFMAPICPTEAEMFAEWGHVRRGYSLEELSALIGLPCERAATFISPLTVLCHDVSFSRAPGRVRRAVCLALWPLTWVSYLLHRPTSRGTETVSVWRKPLEAG